MNASRGEKRCSTGYECISAAGGKLPFWIMTKRKTDRWHAKFAAAADVMIQHTPSGWTDNDMMVQYANWFSKKCQGEPLILILDLYEAQRTLKLKQRAHELKAEIVFVPAGGTSLDQPLHRRVWREPKSRARHTDLPAGRSDRVQLATPEEAITIGPELGGDLAREHSKSIPDSMNPMRRQRLDMPAELLSPWLTH
jgi:hypothetical protein